MKTKKKMDYVSIALYKCAFDLQMKVRAFEEELKEHLEKNYKIKSNGWDFESIISDSLYGTEGDVEVFMKLLKEQTEVKKGDEQ